MVGELGLHLFVAREDVPHLLGVVSHLQGGVGVVGGGDGDCVGPKPPRLEAEDVMLDPDVSRLSSLLLDLVFDLEDLT